MTDCASCTRQSAKAELGKEINWAGGWQEFYQTKDKNHEMYCYWTERYNKLRAEYARLYG